MISLDNITVRFGGFELFGKISFMIGDKEKVSLVGRNGAGKSTLLKLIAGIEEPDEGTIVIPKGQSVGYLPQQMVMKSQHTVLEETLSVFNKIRELEDEIEKLNFELSEREDYESTRYQKIINKLSQANEELEVLGGITILGEAEKVLMGLGFKYEDLDKPTSIFSGGWKMRIELAKILLLKPEVLLLDEPTNHLDIESILWLEDLLKSYNGSVLLISHDRTFLDRVTSRTIEITLGKVNDYNVPFSMFQKLREERRVQLLSAYRNQQKMIEKSEEFIERFRYKATKAVQVQSRIKQLNKLERIEIEGSESDIHFKFPPAPRAGDIVLEALNLSKSFGDKNILNNVNLSIERGEKVAFVGRNGEGKTTLAKTIVGELEFDGTLKIGHNVTIGYYAQNQDELLDENKTVFQTIDDIAIGDIRTKIRGILGAFMFGREDIDKKVKILSGGERSRLSMIKLLLTPVSLLVLDEPTNHLDMASKDILKQALLDYNGTLILVSHDRYFLNGLVEKVFEFRSKKVKEYLGGVFEFLEKRNLNSLQELDHKSVLKANNPGVKATSNRKKEYLERKDQTRQIRKLEGQILNYESEIEKLEGHIREMDKQLANPESIPQGEESKLFYSKYNKLKRQLDHQIYEWEILSEELEQKKSSK